VFHLYLYFCRSSRQPAPAPPLPVNNPAAAGAPTTNTLSTGVRVRANSSLGIVMENPVSSPNPSTASDGSLTGTSVVVDGGFGGVNRVFVQIPSSNNDFNNRIPLFRRFRMQENDVVEDDPLQSNVLVMEDDQDCGQGVEEVLAEESVPVVDLPPPLTPPDHHDEHIPLVGDQGDNGNNQQGMEDIPGEMPAAPIPPAPIVRGRGRQVAPDRAPASAVQRIVDRRLAFIEQEERRMQERQKLFLLEQRQAVHAQRIRMEKEAAEAQYWRHKTHLLDAEGRRNGLPTLVDDIFFQFFFMFF